MSLGQLLWRLEIAIERERFNEAERYLAELRQMIEEGRER